MATNDDFRIDPEVLAEMDVVRQTSDEDFMAALDAVSTEPSIEPELDLASREDDDMVFRIALARVMRRREG